MSINPLDTSGFPPRWYCGPAWSEEPTWGWIHIVSDVVIWLSYLSIPAIVLTAVKKRGDIPVRGVVGLFAAFVVACGFTHLIEAIIFWWPAYRLSAVVKLFTAVVSVVTAIALVRVFPQALQLRSPRQLETELASREKTLSSINQVLGVDPTDLDGFERFAFERMQLRLALEGGKMGAWFWDIQSDRLDTSEEQRELLKLDGEELASVEKFMERVDPDDLPGLQASIDRALTGQETYDHRFRFRNGNNETIWLGGRGQLLMDDAGKPRALVGVNWDATIDQQIREELTRQKAYADAASRSKGEFLANVSHEIRTPLTAILGCADLLFPKLQDEDASRLLETIRRQGTLLQGLLNDVLDLSKIEAGELHLKHERVHLRQIASDIESLMSPLAIQKQIQLETVVDDELPDAVFTDPIRVRQILLNLVSNAIKFTDSGTVVQQVRGVKEDGEIVAAEIIVSDTGAGIPEDQLSRIFAPFEQLDTSNTRLFGGTGLGLSIADRLVDLLGGIMEVESKVGVGTTFVIRLPVEVDNAGTDREPTREPTLDSTQSLQRLPLNVLVVEDTDTIQFVLERMLEPIVDSFTLVENGQAAVNIATQTPGRGFDVILMDLQMPVMDGFDATRLLRERGYSRPIFALSAAAMADDSERAIAAGCNKHLTKPIDQRTLYAALKSAMIK